ncbi:MAG: hypothetical protein IPM42_03125 [Saprospiraceae bacterium]|nr:hypothetical protein [Saprospiraceae bacterium]
MSLFSKPADMIRLKAFEKFVFENNMNFSHTDEFGLKSLLEIFSLFKDFRKGKITNLCSLRNGEFTEDEYLFDFSYVVSTGKTTHTYRQTIYFVNSKLLALPYFKMKPEHFGHKLATLLGIEDIDFTEYPVFSQKYHLKGDDEHFVRATFKDHVLKFFSQHHGWTIEAANYYLIFYKAQTLAHQDHLNDFFKVAKGVYHLFKEASEDHLDMSLPSE